MRPVRRTPSLRIIIERIVIVAGFENPATPSLGETPVHGPSIIRQTMIPMAVTSMGTGSVTNSTSAAAIIRKTSNAPVVSMAIACPQSFHSDPEISSRPSPSPSRNRDGPRPVDVTPPWGDIRSAVSARERRIDTDGLGCGRDVPCEIEHLRREAVLVFVPDENRDGVEIEVAVGASVTRVDRPLTTRTRFSSRSEHTDVAVSIGWVRVASPSASVEPRRCPF